MTDTTPDHHKSSQHEPQQNVPSQHEPSQHEPSYGAAPDARATPASEPDTTGHRAPEHRHIPVHPWGHLVHGPVREQLDLVGLARVLWSERRTILGFCFAGALLGVSIGLLSPKQYTVTATLMPEFNMESIGGGVSSLLRQFGGTAGLPLGGYNAASSAIRVELYPEIVQTLPFQRQLMEHPFYVPEVDSMATLHTYFTQIRQPGPVGALAEWTMGLPNRLVDRFAGPEEPGVELPAGLLPESVIRLDESQMEIAKILDRNVTASLNQKSGIINIEVTLPDPILAATVGQYVIEQLTLYLNDYITEKVMRDLTFTEQRLAEARTRYEQAGLALSEFMESNQGTPTARVRNGEQMLQSEYEIAFGIYSTLSQKLEQQKLKVQEETPVFKSLQPVSLPNKPSAPDKAMIALVCTLFAGLASLGLIYLRRAGGVSSPVATHAQPRTAGNAGRDAQRTV